MQMVLITDQKCITGKIIYVGRMQNHATTWGEQFFRGRKVIVQILGHHRLKMAMYIRADTMLGLMCIPRGRLIGKLWNLQIYGQAFQQGDYGVIYIDSIQPVSNPLKFVKLNNYFN